MGIGLDWTGGRGTQCVLRSADPSSVGAPIDSLETFTFEHTTPTGPRPFYIVTRP